MSIAKVIEITAESNQSFDDAIRQGIQRAGQTVENVRGAWIRDHEVVLEGGEITAYRVKMKVTFVLS